MSCIKHLWAGDRVCPECYPFVTDDSFVSVEEDLRFKNYLSERRSPIERALNNTIDNVNNPTHYTSGDVECIDAIRAALTADEFRGFLKGNVFKYVWRERLKGGDESCRKAKWYLEKLLASETPKT